jgi:hypothetical protein
MQFIRYIKARSDYFNESSTSDPFSNLGGFNQVRVDHRLNTPNTNMNLEDI